MFMAQMFCSSSNKLENKNVTFYLKNHILQLANSLNFLQICKFQGMHTRRTLRMMNDRWQIGNNVQIVQYHDEQSIWDLRITQYFFSFIHVCSETLV